MGRSYPVGAALTRQTQHEKDFQAELPTPNGTDAKPRADLKVESKGGVQSVKGAEPRVSAYLFRHNLGLRPKYFEAPQRTL